MKTSQSRIAGNLVVLVEGMECRLRCLPLLARSRTFRLVRQQPGQRVHPRRAQRRSLQQGLCGGEAPPNMQPLAWSLRKNQAARDHDRRSMNDHQMIFNLPSQAHRVCSSDGTDETREWASHLAAASLPETRTSTMGPLPIW